MKTSKIDYSKVKPTKKQIAEAKKRILAKPERSKVKPISTPKKGDLDKLQAKQLAHIQKCIKNPAEECYAFMGLSSGCVYIMPGVSGYGLDYWVIFCKEAVKTPKDFTDLGGRQDYEAALALAVKSVASLL